MTQKASGKFELIELQEYRALQLKYKSTPITTFWKFVPESKYPGLKKIFQYWEQHAYLNHFIPL